MLSVSDRLDFIGVRRETTNTVFTLVFCPGLSARSAWKYAFTQRFQKRAELGRMCARAELGSLFENEPSMG